MPLLQINCLLTPPPVRTTEGYKIAHRTALNFLSARIAECHRKKHLLATDCYFQLRQLVYILRPNHLERVKIHAQNVADTEKRRCKTTQKEKFQQLFKKTG